MTESNTQSGNTQQPGLASKQDASARSREIQRRILLVVPRLLEFDQRRREFFRRLRGASHQIDFFHQVDDPYSELALQAIVELEKLYDVEFRFHLVSQTDRIHAPEPELLLDYARRDSASIAPHYGLEFPSAAARPSEDHRMRVESMLAGLTSDPRFLKVAIELGRVLWRADSSAIDALAERIPSQSASETKRVLEAGNRLRSQRRHYSGGMFWYAGEWYWGVDRLHHLERRLIRLGVRRSHSSDSRVPGDIKPRFDRPPLDPGPIANDGRLHLDIFPSLRSPYTAVIFERSIELAKQANIPVTLRPVMPMVMRGVPAPAAKGIYIMLDAIREAEYLGVPFGNMLDPIGRPVERGFSLWPFARDRGRGAEYIAAFLRAAFVNGQPTGTDEGLARVLEEAGLSFEEAKADLGGEGWREELEANRQLMYDELGLWGVPSYRLRESEGESEGESAGESERGSERGSDREPDLCVWGQDRLWLVAAEIRRRLAIR